MKTIRTALNEWAYPTVVLISWMMATAYTISKII